MDVKHFYAFIFVYEYNIRNCTFILKSFPEYQYNIVFQQGTYTSGRLYLY